MTKEHNASFSPKPEICLPEQVDLSGIFWIDPAELGTVKDMINSTRLSTMALGVESRRDMSLPIDEILTTFATNPENPLLGEQKRAMEVGYLYGSLLTAPKNENNPATDKDITELHLPEDFLLDLAGAQLDLDLESEHDNYVFFMRLRDVEVKYTGSDVLAFCLAATQDHMGGLFSKNHKGDERLEGYQVTQLQSWYYAGVLLGAYANTEQDLPLPQVEILRGRRDPVEHLSARLEFEASDNLHNAIEYQLSSKHSFYPMHHENGKNGFAIVPGSLQFGPNTLSMPLFIPGILEDAATAIVPEQMVNAVIVKQQKTDEAGDQVTLGFVTDIAKFFEEGDDKESEQIVGLLIKDYCLSAIDVRHPWAPYLDELIREETGIEQGHIRYLDGLQLREQVSMQPRDRKLSKYILGFVLAAPWISEVSGHALVGKEIAWQQTLATNALVMAVWSLTRMVGRRINRRGDAAITRLDAVLQANMDEITLHQPKNSGNIAL